MTDTPVLNASRFREVVAGVIFDGDKVLLARRSGGALDGYWELPGGKVEDGESHQESLRRELKEELGIEVVVGRFIGRSRHSLPGSDVEISAYVVSSASLEFRLSAHSAVAWVEPGGWRRYRVAPADLPLLERLSEVLPVVTDR